MESESRLFEQAIKTIEEGRSKEAADMFRKIYNNGGPYSGLSKLNLINILSDDGKFEEAVALDQSSSDDDMKLIGPHAYGVRGRLVEKLSKTDQAADYQDVYGPQPPLDGKTRYLIVLPWGCGFWGEVMHVVFHCLIAEITNRVPVVLWNQFCRYHSGPPDRDAWTNFFEPLAQASGSTLLNEIDGGSIWPAYLEPRHLISLDREGWKRLKKEASALGAMNRADDIVVAARYHHISQIIRWIPADHLLFGKSKKEIIKLLFRKYIKINSKMAEIISRDEEKLKHPILGIHFRAQSDMKTRESIESVKITIEDYIPIIDHHINNDRNISLFLATDYAPALEFLRKRYKNRLASAHNIHRLDDAKNIEIGFNLSFAGDTLAREVIRDTILALACDIFLGDGASAISCVVEFMKDWPEGTFHLLRRNVFTEEELPSKFEDRSA